MPAPDISVILTSYRFRPYLRAAVESLLGQHGDRLRELIVIDDASPDRDHEVLAGLDDPRLRLIVHAQNQGAAASINAGFALASGRYIGRFDGDDVWLPDALGALAQALDEHPQATVAYGDIRCIDPLGRMGSDGIRRPAGPLCRDEFGLLLERHYTCAPAMLSRRDAWHELLPWPEAYGSGLGDWYFNLRLARLGAFVHVPRVLAHYRVHALGMHHQYVLDGQGERNLRAILAELLPQAKPSELPRPAKAIRAEHLGSFADAYFGQGMEADARRVYAEVLRLRPWTLCARIRIGPALATLTIGRARYERLKAALNKLRGRQPPPPNA
jgi:glycosyltransferase involved in cell wall biosynthesis